VFPDQTVAEQYSIDAAEFERALVAGAPGDPGDEEHVVMVQRGLRVFCVDSLEALAVLAARSRNLGKAVRLLAACHAARERMGYARAPINQPAVDMTLAATRDALSDDVFTAAWEEGAALSLDDAVEYATRACGARARPSSGWASLTTTERQVVRLVADGLTNPQIAARLFVTRATVKTHLSHIFSKLGVINRTELTVLSSRMDRDQNQTPPDKHSISAPRRMEAAGHQRSP
jgi:DNA-binding CsgD family transcriptional regulator